MTLTLTFYFSDAGAPATGLSPTVDGWKVSDGTQVLTDEALTEIGGGWYKYAFSAYLESEDYVFVADGGAGLIGGERYSISDTGALGDLLQIEPAIMISEVQARSVSTGRLAIQAYHTFEQAVRSDTNRDLNAASKIWCAVKSQRFDTDAKALFFWELTDGLSVVNGVSYKTGAHGTIAVSGSAGDWTITLGLNKEVTGDVTPKIGYYFEVKADFGAGDDAVCLIEGDADVFHGVVREIVT